MKKPPCPRCGQSQPCCCFGPQSCRHTAHLPGIAHAPTRRWLDKEHQSYWRRRFEAGVELGDRVAAWMGEGDVVRLASRLNGGIVWINNVERATADVMRPVAPMQVSLSSEEGTRE